VRIFFFYIAPFLTDFFRHCLAVFGPNYFHKVFPSAMGGPLPQVWFPWWMLACLNYFGKIEIIAQKQFFQAWNSNLMHRRMEKTTCMYIRYVNVCDISVPINSSSCLRNNLPAMQVVCFKETEFFSPLL
jgi:hypothetical protein